MKIYLSGPITYATEQWKNNFTKVANWLDSHCVLYFNPTILQCPYEDLMGQLEVWQWYMKQCLPELVKCDIMLALPGSSVSEGAQMEAYNARKLGIGIWEVEQEWIDGLK